MKVKGYKNKNERWRRAVWETGQVCSRAWPSFGDLYLSLMGGEMAAVGINEGALFRRISVSRDALVMQSDARRRGLLPPA